MSLREFAMAVAAELDGFSVIQDRTRVWLAHTDGRRLVLQFDGQRVAITGCYPPGGRPPDPEPRITVDPDRSPAAAAGAVAQWFLPRYAHALAQVRAVIAKEAADQARRAALADRLARALHGEVSSQAAEHTRVRWSVSRLTGTEATGWGDIELLEDASTARLHADRVPIAVVERFVEALASLATDPPAGGREQSS